jgi:hypothetical protein
MKNASEWRQAGELLEFDPDEYQRVLEATITRVADAIIRDICELLDDTAPAEELREIIERNLEESLS